MSVAALHAQIRPARHGWSPLLWLVPITALWILLTYAAPAIGARTKIPAGRRQSRYSSSGNLTRRRRRRSAADRSRAAA